MTEHEKYVQGATKPGGFAEQGCFKDGTKAGSAGKQAGPVGTQFLSTSPPWKCSVCNVTCTSEDNLAAHASGAKHRRKVHGGCCVAMLRACCAAASPWQPAHA